MGQPAESRSGRSRLLAAAAPLFASRPYADVSVGQILQQAKVQAPTLYHHFGDKEGLYVAWALGVLDDIGKEVSDGAASTTRQSLVAIGAAVLRSGASLPLILLEAAQMNRGSTGELVMDAYFERLFEPLCGVIVRGIEAGEVTTDRVDRLAQAFIALCSASYRSSEEPEVLAEWIVAKFMDGAAG